jgi:dienelactone hydrolase
VGIIADVPHDLSPFSSFEFTHDGVTRDVYRAGSGLAVIVVHELPGLHPGVVDFGRRLVDAGWTVYLPSLFGRPGESSSAAAVRRVLPRLCVSREFAILADRTSRVVGWLRGLATRAHADCGGPGVGAVGMCFTGGFALAMAVEPAVVGSVLSQPSLPAVLARNRAAIGLGGADLACVRDRARRNELRVLGLRFSQDGGCPPERFARLRDELGAAFEGIEIDSSAGNPHGINGGAHAVLTVDLVDEPGHPTRAALDRVQAFLTERLGGPTGPGPAARSVSRP